MGLEPTTLYTLDRALYQHVYTDPTCTLYSGIFRSCIVIPLPPAWKKSRNIWSAKRSRACMYSDPFLLGTLRSTPERERRLISHRLARSLGVWGGARGVGREGGKEEVDEIYGDSTFPPPPYNYTTPVTPLFPSSSFPPPPHSTPPCSYCAYRQSTECSRKSPSV